MKDAFNSNDSSSSSTATSITTQAKPTTFESMKCDYDSMNLAGEDIVLNQLNYLFSNEEILKKLSTKFRHALTRYRCKLNLRKLKRVKRLKLFDIDAYTNELIDSEKSHKQVQKEEVDVKPIHHQLQVSNISSLNSNSNKNNSNNDVEIIAVYRVLDRFNKLNKKFDQFNYSLNLSFKIGLIEYRNDDIKCIVSPYTKK